MKRYHSIPGIIVEEIRVLYNSQYKGTQLVTTVTQRFHNTDKISSSKAFKLSKKSNIERSKHKSTKAIVGSSSKKQQLTHDFSTFRDGVKFLVKLTISRSATSLKTHSILITSRVN